MPEFIGEAPKFTITDGNVFCTWPDRPGICVPLRVFRLAYARAGDVLAEHDRERVVAFPQKKARRDPG